MPSSVNIAIKVVRKLFGSTHFAKFQATHFPFDSRYDSHVLTVTFIDHLLRDDLNIPLTQLVLKRHPWYLRILFVLLWIYTLCCEDLPAGCSHLHHLLKFLSAE